MSDNENNQDNASDRNDHFLSNRRLIESGKDIHGKFGGPARHTARLRL
jgi:hypothetical protein